MCLTLAKRTNRFRPQGRHQSGNGSCPKADIVRRAVIDQVWDFLAVFERGTLRQHVLVTVVTRQIGGRHCILDRVIEYLLKIALRMLVKTKNDALFTGLTYRL